MPELRDRTNSRLLAALMALLAAITLGAVALLAIGRVGVVEAITLVVAPWALLAAVLRPDWLLLTLVAMPASLVAAIQTTRILLLVSVALAALLVTRKRLSLGLRTGLVALIILNVAGHLFLANVGHEALSVNAGTMIGLTYYILLALLALNLALLDELDGERLGKALIVGVMSTLAVGLAGYGGGWFESGPGILTHTYLGPMAAAAFGVTLAPLLMPEEFPGERLGNLLMSAILLGLVIASLTRASWIAVAITFGLIALRTRRRGYLLVLIAAIALALFVPTARQQISRSETETGDITTGRLSLWTGLWERAQPALPWGNGFGYIASLSSQDLLGVPGQFNTDQGGTVPAHNDFMYLLTEFGLPGVFLLAFFWVRLFMAGSSVARSADPGFRRSGWLLLGALVTGLVFSMFDDLFFVRPIAQWFFPVAGFVFGLGVVERIRRRVDGARSSQAGSGNAPAQPSPHETQLV
jgi:hypothetical protein